MIAIQPNTTNVPTIASQCPIKLCEVMRFEVSGNGGGRKIEGDGVSMAAGWHVYMSVGKSHRNSCHRK
ncbi:MAG: hypothetical protein K9G49_04355 [Taibaiella sp.]|nr:hypothetical protein [Taibaiella sp.]